MLIRQAVTDPHARDLAIHVVDITAGHGRCVLDTLGGEPTVCGILLYDCSELNVAQGQGMIAQRGMSGQIRFEQGDALNPEELSTLTPRPILAIAPGLHEPLSGDEQMRNSLAGLTDAIKPGDTLICAGQPWHPQLGLIAGILVGHRDGKP